MKVLTGSGLLMCSEWAVAVVSAGTGDQVEGYWDNPVVVVMEVM